MRCALQYVFIKTGILRPEKRKMAILNNVSGVIKPGRTTLLLGPPAAGKSTLLKALAGKLQNSNLKVRVRSQTLCTVPGEVWHINSVLELSLEIHIAAS